jgi:hypothetical protein
MLHQEIIFREVRVTTRKEVDNSVGLIYRNKPIFLMIVINFFILSACGGLSNYKNSAKKIALAADLKPILLHTSTFRIAGFYRISKLKEPLTIYIEGDGLAWLSRYRPSANPTPKKPIALKLAALDKNYNVVYLARPCQYVNLIKEKLCKVPYWTQKRFSNKVIVAINEAINIFKLKGGVDRIHLVGYSGGGAVAALAASRRKDIASLRTVAGYMDHISLNRETGVSPLKGSLDPIRAAPYLEYIPQIHYSGIQDKRIPRWVAQKFIKAVGNNNCTSIQKVNATHGIGWEKIWGRVWSIIPTCH